MVQWLRSAVDRLLKTDAAGSHGEEVQHGIKRTARTLTPLKSLFSQQNAPGTPRTYVSLSTKATLL